MSLTHKAITTKKAPAAVGPYSQAVTMLTPQPLIFVSGILPIDPDTNHIANEDITAMTRRTLTSIRNILEAAGTEMKNVLRVEIFCKELKRDFAAINAEYALHFLNEVKPARQTVEVAALPMESPIEISCIALIPENKSS